MARGTQQPLTSTRTRRRAIVRRLATIIGLNIAGYSLMIGAPEEDTPVRVGAGLERLYKEIERSHGTVFSFSEAGHRHEPYGGGMARPDLKEDSESTQEFLILRQYLPKGTGTLIPSDTDQIVDFPNGGKFSQGHPRQPLSAPVLMRVFAEPNTFRICALALQ